MWGGSGVLDQESKYLRSYKKQQDHKTLGRKQGHISFYKQVKDILMNSEMHGEQIDRSLNVG